MPSYFTPKQERMYEHVKENVGSKRIAAMTVNKFRSKHGLTKKKKKGKADDIDGVLSRTSVGKASITRNQTQPMARGRGMPRVAGTKQPKTPRLSAPAPRSSAMKPVNGDEVSKSLHIGGRIMKGTFESIFKGGNGKANLRKAGDAEESDTDDEMSKAEDDAEELEADADDEGSEVEKGDDTDEDQEDDEESGVVKADGEDEDEEEGEEAFDCHHCGGEITVSDVERVMAKGEIHRKGVGGSPKGKQKHGEKKPARTAVTEMHGGGTDKGGKLGGNKTPVRGVKGVAKKPNPGETGSYKSFSSPLMTLVKSDGPAGDEAIAREIAKMNGVPYEEVE